MFVAAVPPDDVLEDLEAFLGPRREAAPFRWTRPEAWHLTLAFMPEVAPDRLDELVERLDRAAGRRHPPTLRIGGGGAYPGAADARVLYARVEGDHADQEELRRLATGARAAATKAGAPVQGGRFRPHLTLARLRRPDDVSRWLHLLDTFRSSAWVAEELALVRSELGQGPGGTPRYTVEELFTLRATR